MAYFKDVAIRWHDSEEGAYFTATVSIDEAWNSIPENHYDEAMDDQIFYYFANEQEFEDAKKTDNDFEFVILEDED